MLYIRVELLNFFFSLLLRINSEEVIHNQIEKIALIEFFQFLFIQFDGNTNTKNQRKHSIFFNLFLAMNIQFDKLNDFRLYINVEHGHLLILIEHKFSDQSLSRIQLEQKSGP